MTTTTKIQSGWQCTDNKEGVDLNNAILYQAASATPELPGAPFLLGARCQGNNGSEWLFVQASTTVSANSMVAIDVNFQANPLTTTLASSLVYTYGIAEFQTSTANGSTTAGQGDYFWALLKAAGGAVVNVATTAAKGVQLYILVGQAGALSSTASGTAVKNIFVNTSLVTTTAAVDVVIPSYITVST